MDAAFEEREGMGIDEEAFFDVDVDDDGAGFRLLPKVDIVDVGGKVEQNKRRF